MQLPHAPRVRLATLARTPAADALAAVLVAAAATLMVALFAPPTMAQTAVPTVAVDSSAVVRGAPVASRTILRGRVLTVDDVTRDPRLPATPDSIVVGRIARRVIAAGEPLRAPAIMPAPLLRAGSPVTVVYRGGALALTVRGTALGDAAPGDRVNVRVDSKQRVEGVLAADGTVVMGPDQ